MGALAPLSTLGIFAYVAGAPLAPRGPRWPPRARLPPALGALESSGLTSDFTRTLLGLDLY